MAAPDARLQRYLSVADFERAAREAGPPISAEPAQSFRGGRDRLTWDHLSWLRDRWPGRLVVKDLLHPADAREAVGRGMDGIIVSNHGGRQLDSAMPSLRALDAISRAVPKTFPVMVDSGFRRGADVLKAIALGARLVFLGRPFLYGAAVAGQAGAYRVAQILGSEIQRDMVVRMRSA